MDQAREKTGEALSEEVRKLRSELRAIDRGRRIGSGTRRRARQGARFAAGAATRRVN
jgi:hypothetical protein